MTARQIRESMDGVKKIMEDSAPEFVALRDRLDKMLRSLGFEEYENEPNYAVWQAHAGDEHEQDCMVRIEVEDFEEEEEDGEVLISCRVSFDHGPDLEFTDDANSALEAIIDHLRKGSRKGWVPGPKPKFAAPAAPPSPPPTFDKKRLH